MANHLTILARTWKAADDNDELPELLYDALVGENNTAYERRVIKALARATNIINDDGTIRTFEELVKDWEYSHSVYGHTSVCGACGKKHIVQNCILKNKDDEKNELIVGSTCVFRYLEIRINGRLLEGEEKEEYLRNEMNNAKKEFRRQMFMAKNPNIMELLDRYEPLAHRYNKWGQKTIRRYRHNPTKKLLQQMSKRMVKFGYPGPKLEAEWDYFLTTAEEQLREHNEFMEEALELKRIADEKHAELRSQREARWAEEQDRIKKERYDNQQEFLKWTEPLLPTMNSWESNARHQIAQRIGMGTPLRGYTRTVQQWKSRLAVQEGAEVDHPVYNQLNEIDVDKLNDWEKNFRQSIMGQLADGKELSPKQAAAISRMMEKFKPTIES